MNGTKTLAIVLATLLAIGVTGIAVASPSTLSVLAEVGLSSTPVGTPALSAGTLLTPTLPLTATVPVTGTPAVTGTVPVSGTVASNEKVANAIATFFGVPLSEVMAKHKSGMGFGELVIAFDLAKASGKTVDEILAMRKGEGWGKIAQSLGVKPGKWGVNLGQIVSGHAQPAAIETPPPAPSVESGGPAQMQGRGPGNGKGNGNSNGKGKGH